MYVTPQGLISCGHLFYFSRIKLLTAGTLKPFAYGNVLQAKQLILTMKRISTLLLIWLSCVCTVRSFAVNTVKTAYKEGKVYLYWDTPKISPESDVVCERSLDGQNWISIAVIREEVANASSVWEVSDANPPSESAYYRLKYEDNVGEITLLEPVTVDLRSLWLENVNFSMVASSESVLVHFPAEAELLTIEFTDGSGLTLKKVECQDLHQIEIEITDIPKGYFYVCCIFDGARVCKRLIKN